MKNNLDPQNINTEDSPAPFHLMKILDEYILFDVTLKLLFVAGKKRLNLNVLFGDWPICASGQIGVLFLSSKYYRILPQKNGGVND